MDADNTVNELAIIGTGFSGLCMAIKLLEAGIDSFIILEKKEEVGGTWRENHYPGAACDVQSHLYSFSFEGNPEWSTVFSGWQEIQAYLIRCVEKYDLRQYIRFKFDARQCEFIDKKGEWVITDALGHQVVAQSLVMGTGPLHMPAKPKIPGLKSFKGHIFHSAEWDHSYPLSGKKVASIGTGGSAIQYVPGLAQVVEKLFVYQRTPPWIMPRNERHYSAMEKWVFKHITPVRKLYRAMLYWFNESRLLPMLNPKIASVFSKWARFHLKKSIKDPALIKKLMPHYTLGCKRVLISNQYYPTFNRSNVELITEGIASIGEYHIETVDGQKRPVDAIVLGTGFHADPRQYLQQLKIIGKGGVNLLDCWEQGPEAYLGVMVSGFPNMFQLVGPNTGLSHNSIIFMIESQVHHIVKCVQALKARQAQTMDVKQEIQRDFNIWVQKKMKDTVWASGCSSWYLQDNGKNFSLWPRSTWYYRLKTRRIHEDHYQWVSMSAMDKSSVVEEKSDWVCMDEFAD